MVSPSTEGGAYSYLTHEVQESRPPEVALYDDVMTDTLMANQEKRPPPPTEPAPEYDEPIKTSTQAPSIAQEHHTEMISPIQSQMEVSKGSPEPQTFCVDEEDNDDGDVYDDFPEDLYEQFEPDSFVVPQTPPPPRRNITVPRELGSISEITLENLTNLDPKEAQLWMLNQMQKMIQKMEDIYDAPELVTPSANKRQSKKPKPKPPPKPSMLCLLYTSPSPRDATLARMPSSA